MFPSGVFQVINPTCPLKKKKKESAFASLFSIGTFLLQIVQPGMQASSSAQLKLLPAGDI